MKASKLQSLLDRFPKSGYRSLWLSYPALYCVAIVIEFVYAFLFCGIFSEHILWGDSNSYIMAFVTLASGKLDLLRTPIYPLILGVLKLVFGKGFIQATIVLQVVIFLISSILFREVVSKFVSSPKVVFWIVSYYLLGLGINQYNYYILTESFSLSLMVVLMYFLLRRFPNKVEVRDIVFSLLTLLIMVFLRPSFLYLLPVVFIYILGMLLTRTIEVRGFCVGVIGLGCITSCIGYYSIVMHRSYGINSMCIINTYNNYFLLREIGRPNAKYADNEELIKVINEINEKQNNFQGWLEIGRIADSYDKNGFTPGDFERFVYNSIKDNKINCLCVIRNRLLLNETVFPILFEYGPLSALHLKLYPTLLQSAILFCILIIYWITRWRRNRALVVPNLLLIMIIAGLWVSVLIGAYGSYYRLCLPSMPALLIMMGSVTNVLKIKR